VEGVILVAVIAVAAYVMWLSGRVAKLERELGQVAISRSNDLSHHGQSGQKTTLPQERPTTFRDELLQLVNHMYTAIIRPLPVEVENNRAESMHQAVQIIDHYIGHHLFSHVPPLRRVLSVSIGIEREYFLQRTGIRDEEMQGLEPQLAPGVFWPASSITIEEWSTHTVVRDCSGPRSVLYEQDHWFIPVPLWQHVLPKRMGEYGDPYLEVVLHDRCIKFWARDGRFGRRIPPEAEAREENAFVVIPLDEQKLADHRMRGNGPREHWIRTYMYVAPDESVRWNFTVRDMVASLRPSVE
jgi:hypothetical protein